jgi:hypothetical protein
MIGHVSTNRLQAFSRWQCTVQEQARRTTAHGFRRMSDALERLDRLAQFSGPRGSMVLVTERRRKIGPLTCEVCSDRNPGGIARGVVLDEPDVCTPWLLWILGDGWSESEHSAIAACPEHQSNPLLKTMRFVD